MIERIHLDIVRGVAKRGTLTACAEELCLTQSALSHCMRRLEARLGTAIWRREGKRLVPTRAGAYLLATAERVLPQLEQAEERLQQFASGRRGSLRIGMECHPCYQWLRPLISPYLRRWPDVDLDVRQKFQFGGVAALFSGEIDLLVTPDPIQHATLVFEPVFDYEQVLLASVHHRLASKRVLAPEDLRGETVLTYPVPRERLDLFSLFLTPAGVLPRQHLTVEDTEVLLQMVAAGRGVAAMPKWLAARQRQTLGLVTLRLGRRGIKKKIHLGLRRSDRGLDYLEGFLQQAVKQSARRRS